MKALWMTFKRLYFSDPFINRVSLAVLAIILLLFLGPKAFQPAQIAIAGFLMTFIIAGGGAGMFNALISSDQLALAPKFRLTLVQAQFLAILSTAWLLTLLIWTGATSHNTLANAFQLFFWLFDLITLATLGLAYANRHPTHLVVLIIALALFFNLYQGDLEQELINALNTGWSSLLLSLTAIAIQCWGFLYEWAIRARKIKPVIPTRLNTKPSSSPETRFDEWLHRMLMSNAKIDPAQSLMRGQPWSDQRRYVWSLILFIGAPLLMMGFLALTGSSLVRGAGFFLIFIIPPVIFLAGLSSDWLLRLRELWLKQAGDRMQLWEFWRQTLLSEFIRAWMSMLLYVLLVQLWASVSVFSLGFYLVIALILLPALSFLLAWLRLVSNPLFNALFIVFVMAMTTLAIISAANQNLRGLLLFTLLLAVPAAYAYWRIKKLIVHSDWRKSASIFEAISR